VPKVPEVATPDGKIASHVRFVPKADIERGITRTKKTRHIGQGFVGKLSFFASAPMMHILEVSGRRRAE
jgi:hypothetical protein